MALSEKELEKQLKEAGNKLVPPLPSSAELLLSLDRVESLLTRVEQSPSETMKKALSPSMKALITSELLRHLDVDVKVAVASCISEITRITAPDAPYEDDQMKEVFHLIVSTFEKLDDISSPSYMKRTSILETVAKVRSCVVMLDLECDALIAEMFQHFFKTIRSDHSENIFSSMETIMTLVLEESEEVAVDLLSSILDVLKLENKEILAVARQLGEKVTEKCATKLKPYLLHAMKSLGTSVDDYSKVVANVFQARSEAIEPSGADAANKTVAGENDVTNAPSEKAVEVALETMADAPPSDEVGPAVAGSPKSVVSNGAVQKEIEDISAGDDGSKQVNNEAHDEAEPSKDKHDNSDAEELIKLRIKPEKSKKRKGKKSISVKSSSVPSKPILKDEKKEVKTTKTEENDGNDVVNAQSEAPVVDSGEPAKNESVEPVKNDSVETAENKSTEPAKSEAAEPAENRSAEPVENNSAEPEENKPAEPEVKKSVEPEENKSAEPEKNKSAEPEENKSAEPSESKSAEPAESKSAEPTENEKESEAPVFSPKTSEEPADLPSPSPSGGSIADEGKKKDELVESIPADVDLGKETDTKKSSEESIPESKLYKRTGKKVSLVADKEDSVPNSVDASKKEDEKTSGLDSNSAKQSGKKVVLVGSQREDKKKRGQGKGTPVKDLAKTPAKDEGKKSAGSAKSTAKSAKDESDVEKASKSSSKRKRPSGKKASKYGKELVGAKVQVWWPEDKEFYEGVIELFDPTSGKHKVSYIDGDVENLKLEKEKWRLVNDDTAQDEGHSSDDESLDESTETPKTKKAKTSPVQGAKRSKTETSTKKAGSSSSKSMATTKSRTKKKNNSKVDGKGKDETPKIIAKSEDKGGKTKDSKSGNKTSDSTPKSVVKSKDIDDVEASKGSNKAKQETPKTASKSKGKLSKSGSKSNTNGGSKAKANLSAMEEESEDVESSPEPVKAPENSKGKSQSGSKSKKSAKKRKRGTKG